MGGVARSAARLPAPLQTLPPACSPAWLAQTFDEVKHKPCKVEKLGVAGLARTKNHIVLRELLKVRTPARA